MNNILEYLDVRNKVQVHTTAITDTAVTIGPWNDSGLLTGIYYMWSDCDCVFKQEDAAIVSSVTADTGIILNERAPIAIRISSGDYFSVKADLGLTGSIRFVRVSRD